MARRRPRWHTAAGVAALVVLASTACAGEGASSDQPAGGSTTAAPTTTASTTTTTLGAADAPAIAAQLAVTAEFVGFPEAAEYREDLAGAAIAEDDALSGNDCPAPIASPDPRLVRAKRVFGTGATAPNPDFAEIDQTTTVYTTSRAREERMRASMDAAAACPREVNIEYGQVTEGWAEVPPPAAVQETGLDARVITATMTVLSTDIVFPHAWGCVGRGVVIQCVSVWTLDRGTTDQHLAAALTATAQRLSTTDVPQ
jgi:hypothetical protein